MTCNVNGDGVRSYIPRVLQRVLAEQKFEGKKTGNLPEAPGFLDIFKTIYDDRNAASNQTAVSHIDPCLKSPSDETPAGDKLNRLSKFLTASANSPPPGTTNQLMFFGDFT